MSIRTRGRRTRRKRGGRHTHIEHLHVTVRRHTNDDDETLCAPLYPAHASPGRCDERTLLSSSGSPPIASIERERDDSTASTLATHNPSSMLASGGVARGQPPTRPFPTRSPPPPPPPGGGGGGAVRGVRPRRPADRRDARRRVARCRAFGLLTRAAPEVRGACPFFYAPVLRAMPQSQLFICHACPAGDATVAADSRWKSNMASVFPPGCTRLFARRSSRARARARARCAARPPRTRRASSSTSLASSGARAAAARRLSRRAVDARVRPSLRTRRTTVVAVTLTVLVRR